MIKFIQAALILLLPISLAGQTSSTLYFKTGNVPVTQQTVREIGLQAPTPAEMVNNHYIRIIKFSQPVPVATKRALASEGIILMDYLPNFAFFAAIPINYNLTKLTAHDVQAVLPVLPQYKLDPLLLERPLPEYAVPSPGKVEVLVTFYPFFHHTANLARLRSHAVEVVKTFPQINTYQIIISEGDIEAFTQDAAVQFIEPVGPPGEPENESGRTQHRSNAINTEFSSTRQYDGTGINIMLQDDGIIGPHIDYQGRIPAQFTNSNTGNHGDHVAGTIMGAGNKNPSGRGMAPGADLYVYRYSDGFDEIWDDYYQYNITITSTSYSNGCNAGYTSYARLMDRQVDSMEHLMHVFSAGNNGTSNCGYGAGAGWGNVTGGHKIGKNVITVANLDYKDDIVSSSSRGPSTDGRIKPDISAKGTSVYSTVANHNYASLTGTSMACPGVSGSLAQLYHAYSTLNNEQLPPSALIKAVVLNTADDIGNVGPDYKHGWGRINNLRAVKALENKTYFSDTINQSGVDITMISVPSNVKQLKVMVYWHDPAAAANSTYPLINNLDLSIVDPSSTVHQPLVLNPTPVASILNAPATPGIDTLNNMEQVVIDTPVAGSYSLNITGTNVPQGPQEYYVVYEFLKDEITVIHPMGGEKFSPAGSEVIRWDAVGNTGNFTVEYSADSGATWTTLNSAVPGTERQFNMSVPFTSTSNGLIKVSRGSASDESDHPFHIMGTPANLQVTFVCPDSFGVTWNPVSGAAGYIVYVLGQKYMDSIDFTTQTSFTIPSLYTEEEWFSIATVGTNGAISERAIAVQKNPGIFNCTIPDDAGMSEILSPLPGTLWSCVASDTVKVKVRLRNFAPGPLTNIPVYYSVNNGPLVSEVFTGTLPLGGTAEYIFNTPADLANQGSYTIKAWVDLPADNSKSNDTTIMTFEVASGSVLIPDVEENFESMSKCATTTNCGATICSLSNGWKNEANGQTDAIDWRVDDNGTTSGDTGPEFDFNPGTTFGNYIYLEASACFEQTGILLSPCIDLSNVVKPQLQFAYHMYGADMGSLSVDLFDGELWHRNIWTISGNQGNMWNTGTIDLSAYTGKTVMVRFVGVTGSDYRSDIALDAIKFVGGVGANFTATDSVCVNEPVTFADSSLGNPTNFSWNFGGGANPPTATGPGPHQVTYTTPGTKVVTMTVSRNSLTDVMTKQVVILAKPVPDFTTTTSGTLAVFNNTSANATSFHWDFGDGNTSTQAHPSHTYNSIGTYEVTLTASNSGCTDSITHRVNLAIGIEEVKPIDFTVYPNPTDGAVYIELSSAEKGIISVYHVDGQLVSKQRFESVPGTAIPVNLESLAKGIYFLKVKTEAGSTIEKIVLQ